MWKKLVSLTLVLVMLAAPAAMAAKTGDPIDGNDGVGTNATWEFECGRAALIPACQWCMTSCIYALIADMWTGGGIGWDWGIR